MKLTEEYKNLKGEIEHDLSKHYGGMIVKDFEGSDLTEDDKTLISKYFTKENIDFSRIHTFKFLACNNRVDRTLDKFTSNALYKIAETIVGKSFLDKHDKGLDVLGRIYKAEVVPDETEDGTLHVKMHVYIYEYSNGKNADVIEALQSGVRKDCSIGFTWEKMTCSVCDKDYLGGECEHYKGKEYNGKKCFTYLDVKEANELSSVWLGAQIGSVSIKSLEGGEDMAEMKELQKQLEELTSELERAKTSVQDFETLKQEKEDLDTQVKTLTSEKEELQKQLDGSKEDIRVGQEARKSLVEEIKKVSVFVKKDFYDEARVEKQCNVLTYEELKSELASLEAEKAQSLPQVNENGVRRSTKTDEKEYSLNGKEVKSEKAKNFR